MRTAKQKFLNLAGQLSDEERQRILSRVRGKLPRQLFKGKVSEQEVVAIQLHTEEKNFKEWQKNLKELRAWDKPSVDVKSQKRGDK